MSQADSSCAASPKERKPAVCDSGKYSNSAKDSADKGAKRVSNNSSSPDKNVRERVLKEVGLTSTSFIGPAFPPKTATVKTDIEDTLSEFYKELEKIDAPDGTVVNPEKQDRGFVQPSIHPKTSTSKEIHRDTNLENYNNTSRPAETDAYQRSSGQKQSSWPHWHQNEPYYPRRPRSGIDLNSGIAPSAHDHQHYPQAPNRIPNPGFHRLPFHRPSPQSAFQNPQNPPSHMNHNWSSSGMTNQYQEQSHFPPFSRLPSTYECNQLSRGFYGDTPHHLDRDEWGYNHNAQPDLVKLERSRDTQEEWSQFGEDYDRRQRFDSENDLREQQHHCRPPDNTHARHSSSVLILMRGLPGSGKSTMARYIYV